MEDLNILNSRGISLIFLLIILIVLVPASKCIAQPKKKILVSVIPYINREDCKRRRLIIEPGTFLKYISRSDKSGLGTIYNVITPTGIKGTVKSSDVSTFYETSPQLAYVKNNLRIELKQGNRWLTTGEFSSFVIKKNSQGISSYFIKIPIIKYNSKINDFQLEKVECQLSYDEQESFNFITNEKYESTNFPEWEREKTISKEIAYIWGCGDEVIVSTDKAAEAKATADAKGGWSFWRWLEVNIGVSFDASLKKSRSDTKKRVDESYSHRMTSWMLKEKETDTIILRVILEKIQNCDCTKSNKISYVFHFPEIENTRELELDSKILINHNWVKEQGLRTGGNVPLHLTTLEDYKIFSECLEKYYRIDSTLFDEIRDFIVYITANIY